MLTLMGVLFSYLETARTQAGKRAATIEADLLREDMYSLLKKYLKGKPDIPTLQALYSTPLPIYEQSGAFGLQAHCRPLLNRIPISWLGLENDSKQQEQYQLAKNLFDKVAEDAELRDSEKLYNLIIDSLKGNRLEFGEATPPAKKRNSMGVEEFRKILDDYRFSTDDPNVYRAKWERYFRLQTLDVPEKRIDSEFLSPELVAYLFDLDPAIVGSEYTPGQLEDFLKSIGVEKGRYSWLLASKGPLAMHCSIRYSYREGEYNAEFDYVGKRIEHFEFQKQ